MTDDDAAAEGRQEPPRRDHGNDGGGRPLPAWRRPTGGEHRYPAAFAVLVAVALQLSVPAHLALHPRWVLPAVELALVGVLAIANPGRINRESSRLRALGLALVAAASLATAWSAGLLAWSIVTGHGAPSAVGLIINGGAIWLTNVIVFALWYWELDSGGPAARANARRAHPDFLFPQMGMPHLTHHDWEPRFIDYLYLAFTNSTAFSPTDVMPLSRWAKLTMMSQAAVSFLVVLLVIARAVNALR
ncbi:DUF1345 domain-containing protein [Actinopolymorpha alba]|uniref:DUF1345 domain-containing protein n=1 Tax=Actinopolymorpha alba TaxID=533267 RepID=UPI00037FB6BD|nr:DUF1345 domain-containing protein [Actinopolymorpha alba]